MRIRLLLMCLFAGIALNAQPQESILNQTAIVKSEFIYPIDKKPTPQCHASTLAQTEEGIIAAWFGGTHEKNPDVGIWISRCVDGKWTNPVEVVNGIQADGKRYPCWNPVLFQHRSLPLTLYYKVGPDPVDWWGMEITSSDNGATWSKPERLPDEILGPIKNKPVMLENGIIISPSSTENDGWRVRIEKSTDKGKTWKHIGPINDGKAFSAIQPAVLVHPNNVLQILCRTRQNVVAESWSEDNGETWSELKRTNLLNPNSGIDAITLKDGRHLIVYNNIGMKDENHNGPRTPLNVAVSNDGINWKMVLVLENNPGEFSYPAVIQSDGGLIHLTYTYNRDSIKHVIVNPALLK